MEHRSRRLFTALFGALFALAIVWCGCSCTTEEQPPPSKTGVTTDKTPSAPVIAPAPKPEEKTTAAVTPAAKETSPTTAVVKEAEKAAEKVVETEVEPIEKTEAAVEGAEEVEETATEGAEEVEEAVEETTEPEENAESLAPYVPTPPEVVEEMLKTAGVTEKDTVYDLGCGDGRIVVMAAQKFGAKGVGVDLNPERIKESTENVKNNKLEERVTIIEGDLLKVDLSPATVVTLYLMPDANRKLKPIMEKALKPGARVVSHDFSVAGWEADETKEFKDPKGWSHTIYLYKMPKP